MKHITSIKTKIISLPQLWSISRTNLDKKRSWKLFKNPAARASHGDASFVSMTSLRIVEMLKKTASTSVTLINTSKIQLK